MAEMGLENILEVRWDNKGQVCAAGWQSEGGLPPPKKLVVADDTLSADGAYRLICEGASLLWQGDFQNARQLLQALGRRLDKKADRKPASKPGSPLSPKDLFNRYRMEKGQRARILGSLLIPVAPDYLIPLRRAPLVADALREALGHSREQETFVLSLKELLGLLGAHEWRRKGVPIAALGGASIHPHYGVYSPVRGEYLDLLREAPIPDGVKTAFDVGTGTGVIAALLAQRGMSQVVATDMAPRALTCARDNLANLGLAEQVSVVEADLFPEGRTGLVVCNPPWLPGKPASPLELAIYDQDSRMLKGFLKGLPEHLQPGGEGWLIISDLAEHLGLRSRDELLGWIAEAGLKVAGRLDIRPRHGKAQDKSDPLYEARSRELTSLWRLVVA